MPDALRINFSLERDDDPALYDELLKFNKGGKRVGRLRTLAHDGLLVTMVLNGVAAGGVPAIAAAAPAATPALPAATDGTTREQQEIGQASAELFGPN